MFELQDPPDSLFEMQRWFAGIITRPFRDVGDLKLPIYDDPTIADIQTRIPSTPLLRSEQRIGIYNQQYWWRLFVLLQEYYPTLLRLFGYRDFNEKIAEPYFLRYPPADWFLPNIAYMLPQWVCESYRERDYELILQISQVDEAYERIFHASTHPPIESAILALHHPIFLQPYVELFKMSADFFSFREKLVEQEPSFWEHNDFPELSTEKPAYFFALYRLQRGIQYRELSEAQYLLLSSFKKGTTIEEACASIEQKPGLAEEAAQGISSWFTDWSDLQLFAKRI